MTKRKPTRGDHIRLALDAVRRENIAANVFASHPGLGAARAYALADEFLAHRESQKTMQVWRAAYEAFLAPGDPFWTQTRNRHTRGLKPQKVALKCDDGTCRFVSVRAKRRRV